MSKRKADETDDTNLVAVTALDLTTDRKKGEPVGEVKVLLDPRKIKKKKKKTGVFELYEWKVEPFEDRFKNYVCQEIDKNVHREDDDDWMPLTNEWDEHLHRNFDILQRDEKINVVKEHDNLKCPFCSFDNANLEK